MRQLVFTLIAATLVITTGFINKAEFRSKPKTILIDVGHGGVDEGSRTDHSVYTEKELVQLVSQKISRYVNSDKVELVFTRHDDKKVSLKERVLLADEHEADLVISLHINQAPSEDARGMEIYYPKSGPHQHKGEILASELMNELHNSKNPIAVRDVNPASFYILKEMSCPALLLELGFISSEHDRAILISPSGQDEIARSIANAINKFVKKGIV